MNAPLAENPTDCRSKNKSETERGADQSHAFRAVLFRSDVGNVRLRGRDVAAGDAVENATGEEHPERGGESEHEKTDAEAVQDWESEGGASTDLHEEAFAEALSPLTSNRKSL